MPVQIKVFLDMLFGISTVPEPVQKTINLVCIIMIPFEPACLSSAVTKTSSSSSNSSGFASSQTGQQGSMDRDCQQCIPSGLRGLSRRDTTGGM